MIAAFVRVLFFFCKQKTAYEMRISDWSSDVCSSDLAGGAVDLPRAPEPGDRAQLQRPVERARVDMVIFDRIARHDHLDRDRKSVVEGKSVSVRVDLGGRRIIKKKK